MLKTSSVVPSPNRQKSDNCAQGAQCSPWLSHQGWPGEIMPLGEYPCNRKIGAMNSVIRGCALLLMAVSGWTEPALARSYLNCLTRKVVIVDAEGEYFVQHTWASGLRQRKRSCLPMARR